MKTLYLERDITEIIPVNINGGQINNPLFTAYHFCFKLLQFHTTFKNLWNFQFNFFLAFFLFFFFPATVCLQIQLEIFMTGSVRQGKTRF